MAARFGLDAVLAHRLSAGRNDEILAPRTPPADVEVVETYDEPLDRSDQAAFAGRILAERLHELLTAHGLACTRLIIEATTDTGEALQRTWRHEGLLSSSAITDRLRWQLEGWLTSRGTTGVRPGSGIAQLRLIPDGVIEHGGLQPGLWGEVGESRDRAHRAAVRLQGLLGPEAMITPVIQGGRGPADRIQLVAWGDEHTPEQPSDRPWPGRLPPPYPSLVMPEPIPIDVLDARGQPVTIGGRVMISASPATVIWNSERWTISSWAGPWPVDEHWIDPKRSRRLVRCQVVLTDGRALLVTLSGGVWRIEGIYD